MAGPRNSKRKASKKAVKKSSKKAARKKAASRKRQAVKTAPHRKKTPKKIAKKPAKKPVKKPAGKPPKHVPKKTNRPAPQWSSQQIDALVASLTQGIQANHIPSLPPLEDLAKLLAQENIGMQPPEGAVKAALAKMVQQGLLNPQPDGSFAVVNPPPPAPPPGPLPPPQ